VSLGVDRSVSRNSTQSRVFCAAKHAANGRSLTHMTGHFQEPLLHCLQSAAPHHRILAARAQRRFHLSCRSIILVHCPFSRDSRGVAHRHPLRHRYRWRCLARLRHNQIRIPHNEPNPNPSQAASKFGACGCIISQLKGTYRGYRRPLLIASTTKSGSQIAF
jgi:hypothetical protein